MFKRTDIAPCGLDCARCRAHLRAKNPCPGCRLMSKPRSSWFTACRMRTCDQRKGTVCGGCGEFPCVKLKNLDKRYRLKYGTNPVDNIAFIRANGIRRFLAKEEAEGVRNGCIVCVHDAKLYPSHRGR